MIPGKQFSIAVICILSWSFLEPVTAAVDLGRRRQEKALSNEIRTWRRMSFSGETLSSMKLNVGKSQEGKDFSKNVKESKRMVETPSEATPPIQISKEIIPVPTNTADAESTINQVKVDTEVRDVNATGPVPLTVVESFTDGTPEPPKEDIVVLPVNASSPITGLKSQVAEMTIPTTPAEPSTVGVISTTATNGSEGVNSTPMVPIASELSVSNTATVTEATTMSTSTETPEIPTPAMPTSLPSVPDIATTTETSATSASSDAPEITTPAMPTNSPSVLDIVTSSETPEITVPTMPTNLPSFPDVATTPEASTTSTSSGAPEITAPTMPTNSQSVPDVATSQETSTTLTSSETPEITVPTMPTNSPSVPDVATTPEASTTSTTSGAPEITTPTMPTNSPSVLDVATTPETSTTLTSSETPEITTPTMTPNSPLVPDVATTPEASTTLTSSETPEITTPAMPTNSPSVLDIVATTTPAASTSSGAPEITAPKIPTNSPSVPDVATSQETSTTLTSSGAPEITAPTMPTNSQSVPDVATSQETSTTLTSSETPEITTPTMPTNSPLVPDVATTPEASTTSTSSGAPEITVPTMLTNSPSVPDVATSQETTTTLTSSETPEITVPTMPTNSPSVPDVATTPEASTTSTAPEITTPSIPTNSPSVVDVPATTETQTTSTTSEPLEITTPKMLTNSPSTLNGNNSPLPEVQDFHSQVSIHNLATDDGTTPVNNTSLNMILTTTNPTAVEISTENSISTISPITTTALSIPETTSNTVQTPPSFMNETIPVPPTTILDEKETIGLSTDSFKIHPSVPPTLVNLTNLIVTNSEQTTTSMNNISQAMAISTANGTIKETLSMLTSTSSPTSTSSRPVAELSTGGLSTKPKKFEDEKFVRLFKDSEPDNLRIKLSATNANSYNKSLDFEEVLLAEGTTAGCLYEDRERFRRNILSTAYSMVDGEPSILIFSKNSSCVGILNKTGKRKVRSMGSLLPKFPRKWQVEAAGFINDKMYLVDSSPNQNVWTFSYNNRTKKYEEIPHLRFSKDAFLQFCDISKYPKDVHVTAFGQVSLSDPTCLVFDKASPNPLMSVNATREAKSLAHSISFLLEKEFITYVNSVFSWLDEPFITSVYVYGSNGELYRIFRDHFQGSLWQKGNYKIMPYSEFPIPDRKITGVF